MSLYIFNFNVITKMKQNIKTAIKKILIFLPLICLLVFVNYFVDPAKIFKINKYEKNIAEILLKELNVANISNYDERLLQKYYIEGLQNGKDIIVLGSSRAMGVNSTLFPNMNFFNNSVSGATIEDYIAIFEMYHKKKIKPKIVILGLDPWLLNKNNNQKRWKSIANYYNNFMSRPMLDRKSFDLKSLIYNEKTFLLNKYLQLFSLSYFQASIRDLFNIGNERNFYSTNLIESDVAIKLFDGSLSYEKEYRLKFPQEVLKDAQRYVNRKPIYALDKYYELDKKAIYKFEEFIDFLSSKNITIIFFFTPYHPYVYNHLINSNEYKIVLEVESYFKRVSLQNNIYTIGSYNPEIYGFNENDFYDGMHPKKGAIEQLFERSKFVKNEKKM